MKKFNAIKILEEEKQTEDLSHKPTKKEKYVSDIHNFVDTYIKPIIEEKIFKENISIQPKYIEATRKLFLHYANIFETDENKIKEEGLLEEQRLIDCNIKEIIHKLIGTTTMIIYQLGNITEIPKIESIEDLENVNDLLYMLQDDEIGFLYKDKKIKKQVANKISDYMIREYTYETKLNKYIEDYIIPQLNKYNSKKKIKFDLNSTDDKLLLISNNIIDLLKSMVFEYTYMSILSPFMKNNLTEEELIEIDMLFNDNEKEKNYLCDFLCGFILDDYDKLDFTKVEKFNFEEERSKLLNKWFDENKI